MKGLMEFQQQDTRPYQFEKNTSLALPNKVVAKKSRREFFLFALDTLS